MSTYRLARATDHTIAVALHHTQNTCREDQSRLNTSSNIGRDKSFVYDLNRERGIVRMRVAFVPRSAEIQPLFWRFVLFIIITITNSFNTTIENKTPTTNNYTNSHLTKWNVSFWDLTDSHLFEPKTRTHICVDVVVDC